MHWLQTREAVPTIRALRDQAERTRRHEMEKALKMLARGEDPQQVLDLLSHSITNKFLHAPSHALNTTAGEDREALESLMRQLYQIL